MIIRYIMDWNRKRQVKQIAPTVIALSLLMTFICNERGLVLLQSLIEYRRCMNLPIVLMA